MIEWFFKAVAFIIIGALIIALFWWLISDVFLDKDTGFKHPLKWSIIGMAIGMAILEFGIPLVMVIGKFAFWLGKRTPSYSTQKGRPLTNSVGWQ